jgi:hypothetical protein
MSDITKCSGEGCKMKNDCHRFTAKANEWRQSYFEKPPIKKGKCDFFWGQKLLKTTIK